MNIPIPRYFTLYNDDQKRPAKKKWTLECGYYERLAMTFGKAADCIGCGSCEAVCPQHLGIIDYLKEVSARFDEQA
jgi:predicted aldo/keto reductase-like oxidoreductase